MTGSTAKSFPMKLRNEKKLVVPPCYKVGGGGGGGGGGAGKMYLNHFLLQSVSHSLYQGYCILFIINEGNRVCFCCCFV